MTAVIGTGVKEKITTEKIVTRTGKATIGTVGEIDIVVVTGVKTLGRGTGTIDDNVGLRVETDAVDPRTETITAAGNNLAEMQRWVTVGNSTGQTRKWPTWKN